MNIQFNERSAKPYRYEWFFKHSTDVKDHKMRD